MSKVYKIANTIDRKAGTLLNRTIASIIFIFVFFFSRAMIKSPDIQLLSVEAGFAIAVFGLFLVAAVHLWRKKGSLSDYLDPDGDPPRSKTRQHDDQAPQT